MVGYHLGQDFWIDDLDLYIYLFTSSYIKNINEKVKKKVMEFNAKKKKYGSQGVQRK